MNFLHFPYFSRLLEPQAVKCYVFSLAFALMGISHKVEKRISADYDNQYTDGYRIIREKISIWIMD